MKKKWEAQESLPIEELREITNEEREYEAVIEAVLFTMGNSVEVTAGSRDRTGRGDGKIRRKTAHEAV